jgi:hypothetical protein
LLLVAAAVGGLLAGLAAGGSLHALLRLRLRWPLVGLAALAVRLLGMFGPLAASPLTPFLFPASLAALLVWTLWHRQVLRGAWVVALGLSMNLVVVLANGGRMPVAGAAVASSSGLARHGVWGQYLLSTSMTRAPWLGDWLQAPPPLHTVLREVYSPGDLVVCFGLALVFFFATRSQAPVSVRF